MSGHHLMYIYRKIDGPRRLTPGARSIRLGPDSLSRRIGGDPSSRPVEPPGQRTRSRLVMDKIPTPRIPVKCSDPRSLSTVPRITQLSPVCDPFLSHRVPAGALSTTERNVAAPDGYRPTLNRVLSPAHMSTG